jgi:TonB family protein
VALNQHLRRMCAAAALLFAGASIAQEITGFGEELEKRAVKLILVATPDYPKDALARGETATIDVTGVVKANGHLDFPMVHATPEQAAFQKAILEVAAYWLFELPVDSATCAPREVEGRVRVWFEIVEGKPKISMSQAKDPIDAARVAGKTWKSMLKSRDDNRRIQYPRAALSRGVEGRVNALLAIERSGKVAKVSLRPGVRNSWFEADIVRILSTWEYEILPGFPERPQLCVELQIVFKLT